jgi:hypothetical protein
MRSQSSRVGRLARLAQSPERCTQVLTPGLPGAVDWLCPTREDAHRGALARAMTLGQGHTVVHVSNPERGWPFYRIIDPLGGRITGFYLYRGPAPIPQTLQGEAELEYMLAAVDRAVSEAMVRRSSSRRRSSGGRSSGRRPPPSRPGWTLRSSCDQMRNLCMEQSRHRPGSVWGESRCASCADVCTRNNGFWPARAPGLGRCDFWNY